MIERYLKFAKSMLIAGAVLSTASIFGQDMDRVLKSRVAESLSQWVLLLEKKSVASGGSTIVLMNPLSRSEIRFPAGNLNFRPSDIVNHFWNPLDRTTYVLLRSNTTGGGLKWGKLSLDPLSQTMQVTFGNYIDYGPFTSLTYSENPDRNYSLRSSYRRIDPLGIGRDEYLFEVVEESTERIVFERKYSGRNLSEINYYWVDNAHILPIVKGRSNSEIISPIADTTLSLGSEIIIGYGSGTLVVTSSEHIGIKIVETSQLERGRIVIYQDNDTPLLDVYNEYGYGSFIELSYFSDPFLFLRLKPATIGRSSESGTYVFDFSRGTTILLEQKEFLGVMTLEEEH